MYHKLLLKKHRETLHPHHIYQIGVLFYFLVGAVLFFLYYIFIEKKHLDMSVAQWYFVIPWLIAYAAINLRLRSHIRVYERIAPMKRPVVHWAILGIVLLLIHAQPIDYERIYSMDIAFSIFSLFLADSYWDFKKITLFQ